MIRQALGRVDVSDNEALVALRLAKKRMPKDWTGSFDTSDWKAKFEEAQEKRAYWFAAYQRQDDECKELTASTGALKAEVWQLQQIVEWYRENKGAYMLDKSDTDGIRQAVLDILRQDDDMRCFDGWHPDDIRDELLKKHRLTYSERSVFRRLAELVAAGLVLKGDGTYTPVDQPAQPDDAVEAPVDAPADAKVVAVSAINALYDQRVAEAVAPIEAARQATLEALAVDHA